MAFGFSVSTLRSLCRSARVAPQVLVTLEEKHDLIALTPALTSESPGGSKLVLADMRRTIIVTRNPKCPEPGVIRFEFDWIGRSLGRHLSYHLSRLPVRVTRRLGAASSNSQDVPSGLQLRSARGSIYPPFNVRLPEIVSAFHIVCPALTCSSICSLPYNHFPTPLQRIFDVFCIAVELGLIGARELSNAV